MKAPASSVRPGTWMGLGTEALPLVVLALLPKCPACVAVYLGFFTLLGVGAMTATKWSIFLLITSGVFVLVKLLRIGIHSGAMASFWLGFTGLAAILAGRFLPDVAALRWVGLASFCAGCLSGSIHYSKWRKSSVQEPDCHCAKPANTLRPTFR